jgi:hypothetical protein
MELRLQEIININNILKSIIDDSNLKIDVCLKFELLSIMKEFQSFVLNYNTICNEKIIEYGEKTKNDNFQISIKNREAMERFSNDIKPLLDSIVSVNINKIKANNIFDKGIKAEYLICLYPIIEV